MRRNERIEREVEETFRAFERETGLSVRPGFSERVWSRIQGQAPSPRLASGFRLWRRVLVPAMLAAMIILNIVTAVFVTKKSDPGTADRQAKLLALAEEFSLDSASVSSYWK